MAHTYKKDLDEIITSKLKLNWDKLREDIKKDGLRNSTLSAQMPSESSSVVSNETNGVEPPRGYLSVKKSKKGPLKQIVPQYKALKDDYTLLWDMPSNEGYINIMVAGRASENDKKKLFEDLEKLEFNIDNLKAT